MEIIQLNLKKDEKIAFLQDVHMDSSSVDSRIDDMSQTAVDKLRDVLKKSQERNVKALFQAGDFFNKISVSHKAVNMLGEVLSEFKEAGIQVFAICGNHDIVRNNMDNIERSPIQTLFTYGMVKHINLETRVIINKKVMITPVDYTEYPPEADKNATYNILLCHMFVNTSSFIADDRHNLRTEDLQKMKYDVVFAGHDHEEYPMMEIGGSIVIRNGALLRGTAHNYNFTRKPNFIVFQDLDNINKDTIEKVEIAHKPYQDVVSNYILNKKQEGSMTGLKDVLSNLAEKLSMSSSEDHDRILEVIKTDPNLPNDSRIQILNYINEIL